MGENDATADARVIVETIARAAAQVDSEDVEQRRGAVRELYDLCRKVGTRARAALPLLLESLADADDRVGESALYGLRYCAPDSIEPLTALAKIAGDVIAVPTLISLLGRSDRADLRQQAAIGLKAIGPPAASAVPALLSVRDDRDAGVRIAVDQALSAVSARRH